MNQLAFLDTDIMLDYLENRNKDVRDIIAQLLLLHKKEKITLVTSAFNIAELIDKEFEIHFIGWCIREKMSSDETFEKLRRDQQYVRTVSENSRSLIERGIKDFVFKNRIDVLTIPPNYEYQELYDLFYNRQLKSQDAINVATAMGWKATYFLTNDSNLSKAVDDLFDVYKLRDEKLVASISLCPICKPSESCLENGHIQRKYETQDYGTQTTFLIKTKFSRLKNLRD
jgi:predicted nucleic acid-binding protein